MHFIFIPYGRRDCVEVLLRDMESQKFRFVMQNEAGDIKEVLLAGSIRHLPFGVIEYVFPQEYLDSVLTTFGIGEPDRYGHLGVKYNMVVKLIQKVLNAHPFPKEFIKTHKHPWTTENVNIIPIGIREDTKTLTQVGPHAGYWHEAI